MEYTKVNHKNLNEEEQDLTWEGWTGLQVYNKITDSLNDLSEAIESLSQESGNSVKSIEIRNKENDNNTILYTYTTNNNTTAAYREVSLTPVSTNTGLLIIDNVDNLVIKYGTNLSIPYQWEVRNSSDTKINYSRAIINATINGTIHQIGYSVAAVRTNTNLEGVITLDYNWFNEGVNNILISFDTSNSGAVIGGITSSFSVDVINPKLNIEWNGNEPYSKLFADNDLLNLNLSVTNSKGGNLTISGLTVTPTYLFYFGTNTNPLSLYNKTDIDNLTLLSIYKAVNNSTASSIGSNTVSRIYVKAVISDANETYNISSNVYMLQYFREDYDGFQFSTILEVDGIGEVYPYITFNLYTNQEFKLYAYYTSESTINIDINNGSYKDGKIIGENTITNVSYNYLFKESGSYQMKFTPTLGTALIYKLNVQKIGDILELDPDIALSLHTKGKSKASPKEWTSGDYETTFTLFDWTGNGWENDVLSINDNARATINFHPFSTSKFTVSFRFQALYGKESDVLISCGNNNTYFRIYPEKAQFYVNNVGITTEFNSTLIHEITFVRYLFKDSTYIISIFVDGVCQKSIDVVADNGTEFIALNNDIALTAENSQLNVYDIIGYKKALSFYKIQSIYNYNMTDATEALNYVVKLNILESTKLGDNTLSLKISNLPVGSVYMLISAFKNGTDASVNDSDDETPWFTINNYTGETGETSKKIRHAVGNIKLIQVTSDGSAHPRNFCVDRATLSALGTSSMYYPIKNFRIYFKKTITEGLPYYNSTPIHDDKPGDFCFSNIMYKGVSADFRLANNGESYESEPHTGSYTSSTDSVKYSLFSSAYGDSYTSAPVNVFCLKADYAESSGSHNTGFARMAHDVLTNTASVADSNTESTILPQQAIIKAAGSNAKYTYDVRSTVDGFPVYLFFKSNNDADDDTAVYFGKYNLNNEKATAETFGFEGIHDYFSNEIVLNEATLLKDKNHFNDTSNLFDITHETYSIDSNGKYNSKGELHVNPTECWEFSNNTFLNLNILTAGLEGLNNIGAFLFPYNSLDNPFKVTDNSGQLAWLSLAWEYRYPDIDGGSEADNLYVSGLYTPPLLNSLYKWLYNHSYPVWQDLSRLEEFANDLNKYFNINFLLKYFMLTKIFGNVDQRIKNCMLGFYCDPFVSDNADSEAPMGHMRAFYIFYDNDTILGVDNNGNLTQPWDVDEDSYPGAGIHALWTNLEECYKLYIDNRNDLSAIYKLGKKIETTYLILRNYLTDTNINKYFVTNQEGSFPDVIHNLDEEVKYIYNEDLSDYGLNLQYISKYQGNRRYHRKKWLEKRLNWLDAKYKGGNYSKYKYGFKISTTNAANSGGIIKLSPALNNWRFYISKSNNEIAKSSLLLIGNTASLSVNGSNFSISDFVDITALYGAKSIDFTDFKIKDPLEELLTEGVFPYLEDLIINQNGNETKILGNKAVSQLLDPTPFPALKNLYFCNITSSDNGFVPLTLTNLLNLEVVDCRGTDINVDLPKSSHLTTLYLESPTYLEIENKPNLNLSLNSFTTTANVERVKALKGNNSSVYITLMTIARNRGLSGENALFIFQQSDDSKYIISEEEALLLLQLKNPTVSGKISTQLLTLTTAGNLTTAFPLFIIDNSTTGDFEISIDNELEYIKEGETVKFLSNQILTKSSLEDSYWTYKVYDYNNNNQEVSALIFDEPVLTSTYAEFKLKDPSNNITSFHYKLEVSTPLYPGVTASVDLYAVPLSSWTARVDSDSLIVGDDATIEISISALPANQTKYDITNKLSYTLQGTEDVDYQPYITIGSTNIYSSNTLHFVYDRLIEKSSYQWLDIIFTNSNLSEQEKNSPKISTLSKLYFSNYVNSLQELSDMNMDIVQYFNHQGSTFTIPDLSFTNFYVPKKNVTNVTWNINDSRNNYKTIKFHSNINLVSISSSLLAYNKELCIDLSECSYITELCPDKSGSGIATINLGLLNNSKGISRDYIICPSSITEISKGVGSLTSASGMCIFNFINTSDGTIISNAGFTPQIKINSTPTIVGLLCGSVVNSSILTTDKLISLIPTDLLYYTYIEGKNILPIDIYALNTKKISARAFYHYPNMLNLTLNYILEIGSNAFANNNNTSHTITINADSLVSIGEYAFSCTSSGRTTINLVVSSEEHAISIGAKAFDYCIINCNQSWLYNKLADLGSNIGDGITLNYNRNS